MRSRALEERAQLDDARSVLFIPLINPAIDSRSAVIVGEALNNPEALKFKAISTTPDQELDQAKAENCNTVVDWAQDIDNNYQVKLMEWVTAGGIYPLVFAKIYIEEITEEVEKPKEGGFDAVGLPVEMVIEEESAITETKEGEKPETEEKSIYRGPMFEILSPHEVLYDFSVRNLKDSPYVIHWKKVDYFYLKNKWPNKITDDILAKQGTSSDYRDFDTEKRTMQRDNKPYDLCEAWIKTITAKGKIKYRVYWFLPECVYGITSIVVLFKGL